jgi:hypothetical protein
MITATNDWSRLIASRFDGQQITTRDLGPFGADLPGSCRRRLGAVSRRKNTKNDTFVI